MAIGRRTITVEGLKNLAESSSFCEILVESLFDDRRYQPPSTPAVLFDYVAVEAVGCFSADDDVEVFIFLRHPIHQRLLSYVNFYKVCYTTLLTIVNNNCDCEVLR